MYCVHPAPHVCMCVNACVCFSPRHVNTRFNATTCAHDAFIRFECVQSHFDMLPANFRMSLLSAFIVCAITCTLLTDACMHAHAINAHLFCMMCAIVYSCTHTVRFMCPGRMCASIGIPATCGVTQSCHLAHAHVHVNVCTQCHALPRCVHAPCSYKMPMQLCATSSVNFAPRLLCSIPA
jgi:hypothetical protein